MMGRRQSQVQNTKVQKETLVSPETVAQEIRGKDGDQAGKGHDNRPMLLHEAVQALIVPVFWPIQLTVVSRRKYLEIRKARAAPAVAAVLTRTTLATPEPKSNPPAMPRAPFGTVAKTASI